MCNRLSFMGFTVMNEFLNFSEFLKIFASLGHNFTFQKWAKSMSLTFSQINQNYIIQIFLFQRFLSSLDSDFMTKK